MVLSLSLSANQINIDGCVEFKLGNSDTYIVTCDDTKYKVTYQDFNKLKVIEFVELGKVKKEESSKKVQKGKVSTAW